MPELPLEQARDTEIEQLIMDGSGELRTPKEMRSLYEEEGRRLVGHSLDLCFDESLVKYMS